MQISSSWLTLGASLSLLIPAWTANAQEFTTPLSSFAKVSVQSDATKTVSSQSNSTPVPNQIIEIEIVRAKITTSASITPDNSKTDSPNGVQSQAKINSTPEANQQKIAKETPVLIEIKSPDKSPSSPTSSQNQIVSSTTEPARVIPSAAAATSGKLDPVQTLVVPTTPSQVKLDITKPITLNEVVELVEKSSPDWIQAKIAVDRARAVLEEAQAGRAATVSSSAQYTFTDSAQTRLSNINNNLSNNTRSQSLSGTVGVNYNIFDSGVNDSTIRTAENNLRIAEASLNQARQTIRLSIVTAYYNLQNTDETIKIRIKAVENAEKSLKDTKARERAGVGTKFDVLQSDVSLANAKQELFNAEAAQLIARRELSRQINYPPTVEITAADKVAPVVPWKLSREETILLALRNRAELDIRKLEREVARNRATTALARLGPQVSVFANVNAVTDFVGIGSIGTGYQLGTRLEWSLYDGGRAAAQVNQFKADQATAESNFERAARQARYDVEEAYINQESRLKQIETATVAVKQAEEALRLSRLRLDAGVGTQLEVITAESDFTRADVNRVQAIIGYNQSRASLERAVSGL
ncbi:MAG: TolC family protein [Pseudanabaena sp.]|jgi:OMF family outer membrane factor